MPLRSRFGTTVVAAALLLPPSSSSAQIGNVFRVEPFPSVPGLQSGDHFGAAAASLGDLDGDGVKDWVVGAPGTDSAPNDDTGAIHFMFLNADGTLKTHWTLSDTLGGFAGRLTNQSRFGNAIANLGDIDGDGVPDLAVSDRSGSQIWLLYLRPNGTVKHDVAIPATGVGASLARLDDLTGDGIPEIAYGRPFGTPLPGSLGIISIDAAGSILAESLVSAQDLGIPNLQDLDRFGLSIAAVGDLDSDGIGELAVGVPLLGSGTSWGGVAILFLGPGLSVRSTTTIAPNNTLYDGYSVGWTGGASGDALPDLLTRDSFRGLGLVTLGSTGNASADYRNSAQIHNCVPTGDCLDYAIGCLIGMGDASNGVGSALMGRSESNRLEVLYYNCPDASWAYRNGSEVNPYTLTALNNPSLGGTWMTALNCISHAPSFSILLARERPAAGPMTVAGEVLLDLSSPAYLRLTSLHSSDVVHSDIPIPNSVSLCGLTASFQGLCGGLPGLQLSNALDIVVGVE